MWYELTYFWIKSQARFMVMLFSSVGQNKSGRLLLVQMAICGEQYVVNYLGHIFQDVG